MDKIEVAVKCLKVSKGKRQLDFHYFSAVSKTSDKPPLAIPLSTRWSFRVQLTLSS